MVTIWLTESQNQSHYCTVCRWAHTCIFIYIFPTYLCKRTFLPTCYHLSVSIDSMELNLFTERDSGQIKRKFRDRLQVPIITNTLFWYFSSDNWLYCRILDFNWVWSRRIE